MQFICELKFCPRSFFFFVFGTWLFIGVCGPLHAKKESEATPTVEIISNYVQYDSAKPLWMGLKFNLPSGWKTYWRYSGDLGKPLSLNWSDSENISNIEVYWPKPKQINVLGYDLVGYEDKLIFPLKITPTDTSKQIVLRLKATYLVCKEEMCSEQADNFKMSIPSGAAIMSSHATDIQKSLDLTPSFQDLANISDIETFIKEENQKYFYNIRFEDKLSSVQTVFVAPLDDHMLGPEEILVSSENIKQIRYPILNYDQKPLNISVSFSVNNEYIEFKDSKKSLYANADVYQVLLICLISFLGGLILNFMPCVLPVLTLKVFDAINHDPSAHKAANIATALGIICTFLIFAVITVTLTELGEMAGWGMHFREPLFLLAMVFILILFSCNLWGFYEILVPSVDIAPKVKKQGLNTAIRTILITPYMQNLFGHFTTGIVATFLATPCTAPFIGTAIAFAMSQNYMYIFLIFLLIGVGFALPYLYLAVSPHILKKVLPKPGMWMIKIKQIAGTILILTTFWILWVLFFMLPEMANTVLWLSVLFVIAALYAARKGQPWFKRAVWASILLLLLTNFYYIQNNSHDSETLATFSSEFGANFEPSKIEPAVSDGKTVFLIFTAQWCITCKFNENLILKDKEILTVLKQENVLTMVGDWTNRNEVIAKFLERYNIYAVPSYIVFSQEYPKGKVLNTLLTKEEVLKYLPK